MSIKVQNLEPIVEEVVDDADVTVEELRYDPAYGGNVWFEVETDRPTQFEDGSSLRPGGMYASDIMRHVIMDFGDGRLREI